MNDRPQECGQKRKRVSRGYAHVFSAVWFGRVCPRVEPPVAYQTTPQKAKLIGEGLGAIGGSVAPDRPARV
jgi:hypothetical protein